MTLFIKDLVNFEEVEGVIKIRKEGQEENIVSRYVISETIKSHLLKMFDVLMSDTHKSFNVIGNYGTGKSHFLAFVAALLEKKETRDLITDDELRNVAKGFKREFVVVKFECPATQEVSLRKIFYRNVVKQLEEKYDIDVEEVDLEEEYDNKEIVKRIVREIKEENPELGLLVIVDEISDFLSQKNKIDMRHDLNFLREIGEVSEDSDFLYIGAMQEHVFTNPRFQEQASGIKRVSERYVDITITKNDISNVIKKRIVHKTANQRVLLEDALKDFQKCFTNLTLEMDKYIDLFPIHPYVINVFEDLPYFEQRGILHFASDKVREILNNEAPVFITYDLIYDFINQTHEIRNIEDVSELIKIVNSLESKVDLLEDRLRHPAKKIIKALAILKMLGKTHKGGATVQELANTLLITPSNRLLFDEEGAKDNIQRILSNVSKITMGQFIAYDKDSGYYYIDLERIVDYDMLVESKVGKQDSIDWEETFKDIVKDQLNLTEEQQFDKAHKYMFKDHTFWNSRRSFREGYLIIGKRSDGPLTLPIRDNEDRVRDYLTILHSPFANHDPKQKNNNELVIGLVFDEDLMHTLKRISAARSLFREGTHKNDFKKVEQKESKKFFDRYLEQLAKEGYVVYGGLKKRINELPISRFDHISDIIEYYKSYFFDAYFADLYPKYPVFRKDITFNNIESEILKSLKGFEKITSLFNIDENTESYLASFNAIREGNPYSDESEWMQLILRRINSDAKQSKMTDVELLVNDFSKKPYGLQKELVYFLLSTLLYTGELIFVKSGGKRIYANEFLDIFKNGLEIFDSIRYLEEEKELQIGVLSKLFNALGIQEGLLRNKNKRAEAIKELNIKLNTLNQEILTIERNQYFLHQDLLPILPWDEINEHLNEIEKSKTHFENLYSIRKIADLGRIIVTEGMINEIKISTQAIITLNALINDLPVINNGLEYQEKTKQTLELLENYGLIDDVSTINELRQIEESEHEIISNIKKLFNGEYRRPLIGKFEQYKDKYKKIYFKAHEYAVGSKVDWQKLDSITQSNRFKTLSQLKNIKIFSPSEFNKIILDIRGIKEQHCISLDINMLDNSPVCDVCHFPERFTSNGTIEDKINNANISLNTLWNKWENHFFNELGKLQDKINLLSKEEYRAVIKNLLTEKKLPDQLDSIMINAVNELTSELQQVDFNIDNFVQHILGNGSVVTVEDLDRVYYQFKDQLLKGLDTSKVRIRIVNKEE